LTFLLYTEFSLLIFHTVNHLCFASRYGISLTSNFVTTKQSPGVEGWPWLFAHFV